MNMLRKYYPKVRFFQIFTIVLILLIIGVATTVTLVIVRMSENFFIDMYTIHSSRVINQIRRNLDSFHYSVTLTMDEIQRNPTVENTLISEQTTKGIMVNLFGLTQTMSHIKSNMATYPVSIVITGCTYGWDCDFIFHTDYDRWPITLEELGHSLARMSLYETSRSIQYHWDQWEVTNSQSGEEKETYVVVKQQLLNRLTDTRYGTALIAIKNSDFAELYNAHTHEGSHMFIVNSEGIIVSSDQEVAVGTIIPEFISIMRDDTQEFYFIKNVDERERIIMMEYLPYLDLYIFNMIDRNLVIDGVINKKDITLIVIGIVVIFSAIIFAVTRKITNSLANVADEISETAHSQFKQYVTVSGSYETRQIALVFNEMLDELHVYVERLMLTQKQKREAELTGLQRQINIHFLYNTLTSIKLLIQNGNKVDTIETINDLITMLQFTVGDMNEVTNITSEVACLESYVRINQKRYGTRIKVHFYVSPEIALSQIPKLIIQPFIENAFVHAFPDKKEGNIDVFIWHEADVLICEVIDNGIGFDVHLQSNEPRKERESETGRYTYFSGIGIKNVKERIQLLYGKEYGTEVDSEIGRGSIVTIRIPNIDHI